MFDAPIDSWYVWVGLGAVSLAVGGLVLSFPTVSPAGAGSVADAVDRVTTSDHEAVESVRLPPGEIRLGPRSLALKTDGGIARARFRFGPVTPVRNGKLRRVLRGQTPNEVFGDADAFVAALDDARSRRTGWRDTVGELTIRRVSWGTVNATLVG